MPLIVSPCSPQSTTAAELERRGTGPAATVHLPAGVSDSVHRSIASTKQYLVARSVE